jgi:diguanylate cyclase (GGDEF)-like protein
VLADFNTRIITILFILSISVFGAHRFGLLNTSLSLLSGDHVQQVATVESGHVSSSLDTDNTNFTSHCTLANVEGFNLCGLAFSFGSVGYDNGIDLSKYDRIKIATQYTSPNPRSRLKISLRNYNPLYSKKNDEVSLKFNTIIYIPAASGDYIEVPLNKFIVENWWISEYNIDFADSQLEFSNVKFLELLSDGMSDLGNYTIVVSQATLYGQLISEKDLLKLMLLIWLIVGIILISGQKNKLRVVAYTDHLTGLYNRRGLHSWLKKNHSLHSAGSQSCIFHLNIDNFKKVNDSYNHLVGDQLLRAFCLRLQEFLTTQNQHLFARLSGDEFIIILLNTDHKQAQAAANNLFRVLKSPFLLNEHKIFVHISLGVAVADKQTNSFESLLTRASAAMYHAKKDGKNRLKIFDDNLLSNLSLRKKITRKIEQSIQNDLFYLSFMPIFHSTTLEIASVEVLIRSTDELLQEVGPNVYIPIAEESDLIKKIDLWVIEQTFRQIRQAESILINNPITFCINISAVELHNTLFSQQVQELITRYDILPSCIEFELTETSLVEADGQSISTLQELRAIGVKLALDDFGTGYTAFNQLIHYPVNCLKIDKSFIDSLNLKGETHKTMIRAILSIAKAYKLNTIAEGIENYDQYQYLVQQGCDYIQGYLFSKPIPWQQLEQLLTTANAEQLLKRYPPYPANSDCIDSE